MTWDSAPTGKCGRPRDESDAAIQTCLTMKVLFGMSLGQTTGFVESRLLLLGLDWAVPNFSTMSRRQMTLTVNIPWYRGSASPLHLLIDVEPWKRHWSERPWRGEVKVEGEGEWDACKHGGTKRRVLRKIHIATDEQTLEARAQPRSYRPARTSSAASPIPQVQAPATRPCAHRPVSVEPSGDTGAAITAEAVSRQGCTV